MKKRLYKSRTDKKICGVCGGLAKFLDVDPTIIRIIWAACILLAGSGLFLYLIAALVMQFDPEEPDIIN